jgi:hypothetical protein
MALKFRMLSLSSQLEVVLIAVAFDALVAPDALVSAALVFVALASVALDFAACVAGPQAADDIALAFAVLVPVSVVAVEVDSPGRSRFVAFPNFCYFARSSSYFEAVG